MAKYKTYFHATSYDNLIHIMHDGIKAGCDGLVYMCEKEEDAIKFPIIHGVPKIITFKIKIKEPDKVIETFDHSYAFFKCRCWGFMGDIPADWIEPSKQYGK